MNVNTGVTVTRNAPIRMGFTSAPVMTAIYFRTRKLAGLKIVSVL